MAAGGSRGDPLAIEPLPEPQPEMSPAEGLGGDQEQMAEVGWEGEVGAVGRKGALVECWSGLLKAQHQCLGQLGFLVA